MAHHPSYRHTRNKTSLGSITYADLTNTLKRPAPGLPPMLAPQQPASYGPQQHQRQHHAQTAQQEGFRRNAGVPTDREIPDGVENMVIGDVVQRYKALRDVERRLDAVIINKRLAVRDSGQRYERRLRTMRVWVSAKAMEKDGGDARMDDAFDFGEDLGSGTYKMRIEGRLLPDEDIDEDDDLEESETDQKATMDLDKPDAATSDSKQTSKKTSNTQKFSHYFKQINIAFQPSRHALPNATVPPPLEWKKPEPLANNARPTSPEANFDALEFERRMDDAMQKVVITLYRDEPSGRVRGKLSEQLARLLDREYEDQSGAMMGLYRYVREKGLEEEGHPQRFRCDDMLRAVSQYYFPLYNSATNQKTQIFKRDSADFIYVPEVIAENIHPLPPITLNFTIRAPSSPTSSEPTIYDIPILVDDPLDSFMSSLRQSTDPVNPEHVARLKQIAQLDADIALLVQGMGSSKAKIAFLNQLTADPVGFVRKWISSQKADEDVIMAEERSRGQEWSRGGTSSIWASDSARENVGQLLARKPL
jgi:SWI/SNF-related matrix-associated actin-dependent regulator of chromatin subfamily D